MKRGRPLEATGARIPLCDSNVYVSPQTKASLEAWRAAYGLPIGRSIDALFAHAMESEGAFLFKLPLNGARESLKKPLSELTKK